MPHQILLVSEKSGKSLLLTGLEDDTGKALMDYLHELGGGSIWYVYLGATSTQINFTNMDTMSLRGHTFVRVPSWYEDPFLFDKLRSAQLARNYGTAEHQSGVLMELVSASTPGLLVELPTADNVPEAMYGALGAHWGRRVRLEFMGEELAMSDFQTRLNLREFRTVHVADVEPWSAFAFMVSTQLKKKGSIPVTVNGGISPVGFTLQLGDFTARELYAHVRRVPLGSAFFMKGRMLRPSEVNIPMQGVVVGYVSGVRAEARVLVDSSASSDSAFTMDAAELYSWAQVPDGDGPDASRVIIGSRLEPSNETLMLLAPDEQVYLVSKHRHEVEAVARAVNQTQVEARLAALPPPPPSSAFVDKAALSATLAEARASASYPLAGAGAALDSEDNKALAAVLRSDAGAYATVRDQYARELRDARARVKTDPLDEEARRKLEARISVLKSRIATATYNLEDSMSKLSSLPSWRLSPLSERVRFLFSTGGLVTRMLGLSNCMRSMFSKPPDPRDYVPYEFKDVLVSGSILELHSGSYLRHGLPFRLGHYGFLYDPHMLLITNAFKMDAGIRYVPNLVASRDGRKQRHHGVLTDYSFPGNKFLYDLVPADSSTTPSLFDHTIAGLAFAMTRRKKRQEAHTELLFTNKPDTHMHDAIIGIFTVKEERDTANFKEFCYYARRLKPQLPVFEYDREADTLTFIDAGLGETGAGETGAGGTGGRGRGLRRGRSRKSTPRATRRRGTTASRKRRNTTKTPRARQGRR